jgi:hypothetical protein
LKFWPNRFESVSKLETHALLFTRHDHKHHQQTHFQLSLAGKHVLCHFPPSNTSAEAWQMCAASAYYPSLVSGVFFPLRALPQFEQMRSLLLDRQLIGPCTSIELRLSGSHLFELTALLQQLTPITSDERRFCTKCTRPAFESDATTRRRLYAQRFCGTNLLSSLTPHLLDLIAYVCGLRATRVSALVRSFGSPTLSRRSPSNRVDLIKRIAAEDFCQIQMEMVELSGAAKRPSNVGKETTRENKENCCQNAPQTSSSGSIEPARKANCDPIGIISIDARSFQCHSTCELLVNGTLGYLSLRDDRIYSKQYEQNNNDSAADDPPEVLHLRPNVGQFDRQMTAIQTTLSELYCVCPPAPLDVPSSTESSPSQVPNKPKSPPKSASNQETAQTKAAPKSSWTSKPFDMSWSHQYAFLLDRFVSDLNVHLSSLTANKPDSVATATDQLQKMQINGQDDSAAKSLPGNKLLTSRDSCYTRIGTFDDVLYVQEVLDSLQKSVSNRDWMRVQSFDPKLIPRIALCHRKLQ